MQIIITVVNLIFNFEYTTSKASREFGLPEAMINKYLINFLVICDLKRHYKAN